MNASNYHTDKVELYRLIQNEFLLDTLIKNYRLDLESIHGLSHWVRVLRNGLYIAAQENADAAVVKLFAVFHDCRRKTENYDEAHGAESAAAAREMLESGLYHLETDQLSKLYYACKYHTDGKVTSDPTVGACWDADRLDLPRVGIRPVIRRISTKVARLAIENKDYDQWQNREY